MSISFLSVAHSEAYGYGFRTYEYLPEKLPGYHVSAARAQEVELGMYSLRSFMLPHLISVSMVLADSVGLLFTPYLVSFSYEQPFWELVYTVNGNI